jgi:signal transduction histidine kinase
MAQETPDVRVVVVAPAANDASAMVAVLLQHSVAAEASRDALHARELIERGAGSLILTEESLDLPGSFELIESLKTQPPWSELPVIVVTSGGPDRLTRLLDATSGVPGSVTFLERPTSAQLLLRSVQFAVNARKRQYQVRDLLDEQEKRHAVLQATQEALREAQSNLQRHAQRLEQTVAERTAKLQETVQELEEFSYTIAHDMRAPLRSMHGFAEILLEDHAPSLNPAGQDLLRRIAASALRLDHLIRDVLSYSRILREELPIEPIDVQQLVAEVIESYPNLTAARQCIQVDAPLPVLMGNRAALTQVLSNLLANAVKFVSTNTAPAVRVGSEPAEAPARDAAGGRWVRVVVEDKGIGIAPEMQPKLFQMFQRFTKPGLYEGTGMGLAIVRKAIERMGGVIGVESAPHQGSRFWFMLPAAQPDP